MLMSAPCVTKRKCLSAVKIIDTCAIEIINGIASCDRLLGKKKGGGRLDGSS